MSKVKYRQILSTLIICMFFNIPNAQTSPIYTYMVKASEAIQNQDLKKAKENYEAILKIDSNHRNAIFNLAAVELSLGNIEAGCSLLQQSYSQKDIESYELIKNHCGGLIKSDSIFIKHVDELPKFKYESEFEDLKYLENKVSANFQKLLKREVNHSEHIRKFQGTLFVVLNIGVDGSCKAEIRGDLSKKEKREFIRILESLTEYQPAVYQGKNVNLFHGYGFLIKFN